PPGLRSPAGVHLGCPREVVALVLGGADVPGPGVAFEELDPAGPATEAAQLGARGLVADLLIGHGLEVLADPQTAGVPRGATGRQRVVGADDLVAVRHAGALTEEHRAV